MQIYPEKYDKLELTSSERSFVRTVERAFGNDTFGYYVLHINPRKKDIGDGVPELFNMLVSDKGILFFRFFNNDNDLIAATTINAMGAPLVYKVLESDIIKKLENSKYLVGNDLKLKFALSICFVFPEIETQKVANYFSEEVRAFCKTHVLFKEDIGDIRKNGRSKLDDLLQSRECIQEDDVNNIFQRVCPEITIPKKFILDETAKIAFKETKLSSQDRAVQSYRLDNWQIDVINRISRGNQLILACAGSGKSVLLISKCFKMASLNPSENFLITCYNRNLNNYYQWAIAQAGFTDRNVKCSTFLGFCKQLLESNKISVPDKCPGKENVYYNRLFEKANDALRDGRIKERFYGIFIDEVQIFKPEWYRFCFNLLKSKNDEEHFFVIAGDKSQDIKNNIKRGKAPWQGGGSQYPEYRGKTLPIEKNYRNSKPINDAIDRYVSYAKAFGEKNGVDLSSDPELFLRGTAFREGTEPKLIELKKMSNQGEAEAICDAIRELLRKGYSEVDIAVIVYNKNTRRTTPGWGTYFYNLLPDIKRIFMKEGWEYPAILITGESEGSTYGSRRGVTIATIEGSLGLDFRAVILAGLRPLGTHEKIRVESDFWDVEGDQLIERQEGFIKNVNFLYTGCTRAKDELFIILSAPRGESIYMDLLRESMKKGK